VENLEEKAEKAFKEVEMKKQREASAAIISIDELLQEHDKIFTVYVPEIGYVVKFKKLTVSDIAEVEKEQNSHRKGLLILHKMWSKADPTVTLNKVEQLPFDVVSVILARMLEKTPFLGINRKELKRRLKTQLEKPSGQ